MTEHPPRKQPIKGTTEEQIVAKRAELAAHRSARAGAESEKTPPYEIPDDIEFAEVTPPQSQEVLLTEEDTGVDTSGVSQLRAANTNMQTEMDMLEEDTPRELDWAELNPLVDIPSQITPIPEGTPLEWRKKLRGYIEAAKENLGVGERVEKLKAYFAGRSKELDAEAGKISGTEKLFRSMGEKYNKLGWKSKIAIGFSLGVGAGVLSAVSMPEAAAIAFAGIAAQRIAGLSSMFLKYENSVQDGKWKKEKAMGKAMLYTAGMTGVMMLLSEGVKESIEYANQHQWGEAMQEWLKSHYPFGEGGVTATRAGATEATPAPGPVESVVPATAPNTSVAPETPAVTVAETPHVSEALQTAQAPEPAVEMPTIGASSHGYEGMLKDLMKQLPDKPPANMNPDSDLAKLFEARARPESIGATIHKIAMEHKFFTSEGSVNIGTDAQMTIDDTGNVLFTGEVHAPAHIPATPLEAPVASPVGPPAPPPEAVSPDAAPALAASSEVSPPADQEVVALPPPEAPTTIENPRPIPVVEPPEYKDTLPLGKDTIESAASAPAAEHAHSIVNAFNVEVSTVEPHIYADGANHLYMYGGSPDQQINSISEYLTKNPNSTVFGTSVDGTYRIPWTFVDGKIVPGTPIRTQGIFGFFSSWMKAPSPDEFEKFIK